MLVSKTISYVTAIILNQSILFIDQIVPYTLCHQFFSETPSRLDYVAPTRIFRVIN